MVHARYCLMCSGAVHHRQYCCTCGEFFSLRVEKRKKKKWFTSYVHVYTGRNVYVYTCTINTINTHEVPDTRYSSLQQTDRI